MSAPSHIENQPPPIRNQGTAPHQRAQERTGRSAQINVKRLAIAFEFVVVRHLDVRHRCFGRQMHQGNERLSRLRGCGTVDPDAAGGGLDRRSGTGLGKLRRKLRYLFSPILADSSRESPSSARARNATPSHTPVTAPVWGFTRQPCATAAFWSSCENISIPPHDSGAVGFHIRRTYRIVYQDLRTSSIVDARRCTIGFQATRDEWPPPQP